MNLESRHVLDGDSGSGYLSQDPNQVCSIPSTDKTNKQSKTPITMSSGSSVPPEIRSIKVQSRPGKWFERPYLEKNLSHKRAGGEAQGVGSEFKH
jgi:hypothetical protein